MSVFSENTLAKRNSPALRLSPERSTTMAAALFTAASLVHFAALGEKGGALQSIEAMLLIALPWIVQRVFHCKIAAWLHAFLTLYCLGPLLGHSYKLFYTTTWWDKLLHCSGGVVFAVVGYHLPLLNKQNSMTPLMRALFALCFSIAISALWEFAEYGSDMLLGTDTQNDTYLTEINSYFLGGAAGQLGSIEGITQVTVNGQALPGYIDIGLIDTMGDMIIETFGALVCTVFLSLDRGRHPAFRPAINTI